MLVLSRKTGEELVIPCIDLTIVLVETRGASARLGINGPREVEVLRREIVGANQQFGSLGRSKKLVHDLRNKLNCGSTGLSLVRRQIESGTDGETILRTLDRIKLSMGVDGASKKTTEQGCLRALLVEDDANERELLAGLLRMFGINVEAVEDGDDALVYLKGHENPDVILLDLNMPRLNGVDFANAVRDLGIPSKIFMVTGTERPSKSLPVDAWFQKPVNTDMLLEQLATL